MDKIITGMLSNKIPEFDPRYAWHVSWLFEDDNKPVPSELIHNSAREAINHLIQLVNSDKVLTHISMSRRNA